jgi:hypothetical protein
MPVVFVVQARQQEGVTMMKAGVVVGGEVAGATRRTTTTRGHVVVVVMAAEEAGADTTGDVSLMLIRPLLPAYLLFWPWCLMQLSIRAAQHATACMAGHASCY